MPESKEVCRRRPPPLGTLVTVCGAESRPRCQVIELSGAIVVTSPLAENPQSTEMLSYKVVVTVEAVDTCGAAVVLAISTHIPATQNPRRSREKQADPSGALPLKKQEFW